MKKITLTTQPESRFDVPYSDGYSVYAALLNVIREIDPAASTAIHDRGFGNFHNSGLLGSFGQGNIQNHKLVLPDKTYTIELGIVDPAVEDVFNALSQAIIIDSGELELTNGTLQIREFSFEETSHQELLQHAGSEDNDGIEFTFETPVCIEDGKEITAMFPHRVTVFNSLVNRWNRSCRASSVETVFDVSHDEIRDAVIEKPGDYNLESHSVLVNRVQRSVDETEGGEAIATDGGGGRTRSEYKQGFTGTCSYKFKNASESLQNALTTVALFAEYSGIGRATARGCGHVSVRPWREFND